MKSYQVRIKNQVVTSVMAETAKEAREEAWGQLNRPGRKSVLRDWVNEGMQVTPLKTKEQVTRDLNEQVAKMEKAIEKANQLIADAKQILQLTERNTQ